MGATASAVQWSKYEGTSFEGALPRLIEPEVLLPSQYFNRFNGRSILEGERRLMLAVLEDAVACFQKYADASRPRGQRLFQEAEEWFFEGESVWPFSFESICDVLGIDGNYFRTNLQRWKDNLLLQPAETRGKIGRVRLRAARRHKILPFVPRRRHKTVAQADS
jgi:hypothetical protein